MIGRPVHCSETSNVRELLIFASVYLRVTKRWLFCVPQPLSLSLAALHCSLSLSLCPCHPPFALSRVNAPTHVHALLSPLSPAPITNSISISPSLSRAHTHTHAHSIYTFRLLVRPAICIIFAPTNSRTLLT
jgi:hypothetical protein